MSTTTWLESSNKPNSKCEYEMCPFEDKLIKQPIRVRTGRLFRPEYWHVECWETIYKPVFVPNHLLELYTRLKNKEDFESSDEMEIRVHLYGTEAIPCKKKKIVLNEKQKPTLSDLQSEIRRMFNIEVKYQNLFYGEVQISEEYYGEVQIDEEYSSNTMLSTIGLKSMDILILKHSELQWWVQYYKCVEDVKAKAHPDIDVAKRAVEHHERLTRNTDFFNVYAKFEEYRQKNQPNVALWADEVLELMANAAKDHFLIKHGQRGGTSAADFKFSWRPRSTDVCGTRKGIIIDVQLHGEQQITKYSMKCHHYSSTHFSSKGSAPDIIELFSYKLLELIGVAPIVHFVYASKYTGTKTVTYIATVWRDDLQLLCDLKESDFNIEALVQLRLLNVLIFISDLHESNCGQWKGTKGAAIIDFAPMPFATHTNVKSAVLFQKLPAWNDTPLNLLTESFKSTFWTIAEKCLLEWDLEDNIKRAKELITIEKEHMKDLELESGPDKVYTITNELNNHVEAIQANLAKFLEELKQPN